ncbi:unnamed protein product [Bursaphelenchus xylophilus]|uniref:(pine wood nematode) hypothetical protein n=1 Tax=Bursaphelenchus xylophilus TaxID=6326 RepID=A0A1I7RJ55_BURXY|nr:unnamed protein product [Bursaphelenchus xylophilus]CAG9119370.1 unnamed protein product [Bursaphelenchus xylophilus]
MSWLPKIGSEFLQLSEGIDLEPLTALAGVLEFLSSLLLCLLALYLAVRIPRTSMIHSNLRILLVSMFLAYTSIAICRLLPQCFDEAPIPIFLQTIAELSLSFITIGICLERGCAYLFLHHYEAMSGRIGFAISALNVILCTGLAFSTLSKYGAISEVLENKGPHATLVNKFNYDIIFYADITKLLASAVSLLFLTTLKARRFESHGFAELASLGARYQSRENMVTSRALKLVFMLAVFSAAFALPFALIRCSISQSSIRNERLERLLSSTVQFINQTIAILTALVLIKFLPSLRKQTKADFCAWRPKRRSAIYASMDDVKLTDAIYDTRLHFQTLQSIWGMTSSSEKLNMDVNCNYM